ncbi:hypothetical protein JYU34_003049 [Plutella xylostella]|uniref:FP protein C-terminal domain-containing protein n=1 Tax=Plutella xylostella TaxID=51655 RepID=A0ABQ7QZ17_PLUXY|nr:hypothetical protein JYU34_003049 [Plutella xylostella]
MLRTPEKCNSESNLSQIAIETTPVRFITRNIKRKRSEDITTELSDFKTEIKDMLSTFMLKQSTEGAQITSSLKTIESSLSFLAEQYEDMRKKMEDMERENKKDKEYICILENKVEELQKSQRKCSLELKNVPKLSTETKSTLIDMATNLSKSLKIELSSNDIKDIYRTSAKGDKAPIVMELSSYIQKTNLIKGAKSYNSQNKNNRLSTLNLGMKCDSTPIFLSDHLTQKGNRLFYLERELSKAQNLKFCWTNLGNVFIRKDENSPIVKIINESQIQRMYESDK